MNIDLFFVGQIGVAVVAIATAIGLLRRFVLGGIEKDLIEIKQEMKPNGGSSLRDAVNRLEKYQRESREDIRDIRDRVDDHIAWHLDNS